MNLNTILAIVLPVMLGINAYYLKNIINSITEVRLKIERITESNVHSNININQLKLDLKELSVYVHKNKDRLHSLEGAQLSINKYLDLVLSKENK